MKQALYFLLLLLPFVSYTQSITHGPACAESRLRSAQRQAIATPAHVRLMQQYDVSFYKLDLQLERTSAYIAGAVTTQAKVTAAPLSVYAFELHPTFIIDSVLINGDRQNSISRNAGDVAVALTSALPGGSIFTAKVYYRGTAPTGASAAIGNGFTSGYEYNWGGANVTWSLSEPYAAYEWWPTKQVLTDKADSVHVFVTTSAENKVGSNGLLTASVLLPENKIRYEWKSRYPIAYYLISVAVSDYLEYNLEANPAGAEATVPIINYIYNANTLAIFKEEIDQTVPLLETFSELFTLYPFAAEKYGHSMAPIGGGMEHQTMTTQSTFTFTLTAHELGHQWFGNNVTCASWADIWLNEGFASYAEYLALEQLQPYYADGWMSTAQGRVLAVPTGSLYVQDTTDVSRIFNYRLSYAKGATVVHMLRFMMNNDTLFFEALRNYQRTYGGRTATTADLQRVFEETTGLKLGYFFEQWYKGEGWPTITAGWEQQGKQFTLNANQTPSASTPFFRTDVEYLLQSAEGDTLIRVPQLQPQESYTLTLGRTVTGIVIDPHNWLLARKQVANVTASPSPALAQGMLLYPNPATAVLHLQYLPFNPTQLQVHDATGRQVLHRPLQKGQPISIDTTRLPPGVYSLTITDGTRIHKAQFVKR